MDHRIEWVEDALLNIAGHQLNWALVNDRETDEVILCIRHSGRSLGDEDAARVLADAWRGYDRLLAECPDLLPPQRQSSSATASP